MAAPLALLALLIELMVGYPDRAGARDRPSGDLDGPADRLARPPAEPRRRQPRSAPQGRRRGAAGAARRCRRRRLHHRADPVAAAARHVFAAVAASTLIAQRSLYDHVGRVADALDDGGLDAGREAVSHIVGRDTAELDEAGVARAAIESLAENFSDGVVAPAFWMVIGGLPGAALYKAINTADSMIGHRTRAPPGFRPDRGAARRSRQPAGLAAVGAADRRRGLSDQGRVAPRRRGRRRGATPASTPRPMPAIRKRRWPARSVCRLPVRASMAARSAEAPGWATGGARRRRRHPRRARALSPRRRPAHRHRVRARGAHRASLSSRSISICAARCAASLSSVSSIRAS